MSAELLLLVGICACALPVAGVAIVGDRSRNTVILIVGAVLVRLIANVANQVLGLFAPKLAAEASVGIYQAVQHGATLPLGDTFLVQVLMAWPFLAVSSTVQSVILANNVGSLLLTFGAVRLLKPLVGRRALFYLLLATLFFPVVVNFCLFALRDPIIYGFVLLYVAANVRFFRTPRRGYLLVIGLCLLAIYSLRPELLIVLCVLPALRFVALIKKSRLGRAQSAASVNALRVVLFGLAASVVLPITILAGMKGLAGVGVNNDVSLNAVQQAVVSRYQRQADQAGGGSSIYSGKIRSMPLPLRAGVSFAGMFLLPFPWTIDNITGLLAFLESILVIGMTWWCVTGTRRKYGMDKTSRDLMISFFMGALIIGFFMINFGNAFRMRLAILPFLFVGFTMIYDQMKQSGLSTSVRLKRRARINFLPNQSVR